MNIARRFPESLEGLDKKKQEMSRFIEEYLGKAPVGAAAKNGAGRTGKTEAGRKA